MDADTGVVQNSNRQCSGLGLQDSAVGADLTRRSGGRIRRLWAPGDVGSFSFILRAMAVGTLLGIMLGFKRAACSFCDFIFLVKIWRPKTIRGCGGSPSPRHYLSDKLVPCEMRQHYGSINSRGCLYLVLMPCSSRSGQDLGRTLPDFS